MIILGEPSLKYSSLLLVSLKLGYDDIHVTDGQVQLLPTSIVTYHWKTVGLSPWQQHVTVYKLNLLAKHESKGDM